MAKCILIVDDERHISHILAHKVKQAGYEVCMAADGEQGYAIACEKRPALIVTDYQMPHLDGHQMARKLAANETTADIPAIMLTARGHRLAPAELLETNIQCLLQKPFSAHELLARIRELLDETTDEDQHEQQVA
jgi:two-component system phosphate regulon response regulator PhoB